MKLGFKRFLSFIYLLAAVECVLGAREVLDFDSFLVAAALEFVLLAACSSFASWLPLEGPWPFNIFLLGYRNTIKDPRIITKRSSSPFAWVEPTRVILARKPTHFLRFLDTVLYNLAPTFIACGLFL